MSVTALTIAAIGTAVAGAGITALGQFQQGRQAERVAEYNAAVQANQAKLEEFSAQHEADLLRERGRKLLAAQTARFAASGVGLAGTPLLVQEETARSIDQDVSLIRFGGRQRASFRRSQASLSLFEGRSARRAGTIAAGTSLLSGATRAFALKAGV